MYKRGGFIVEISGGTASDQIRNLGSGDIMEFDEGEYLYNDDPKTVTIDGDIQVDTVYPDDFSPIVG